MDRSRSRKSVTLKSERIKKVYIFFLYSCACKLQFNFTLKVKKAVVNKKLEYVL